MRLLNTIRFIAGHPLSRNRRLRNLARFAKWQIGSRLVPGPVAIDFVNDARLLVSVGMTGATGNVYVGLHEFEEMAFLLHFLRADDLFVDVGANIGSYTILAGAGVGARCIAFEPDPAAFTWMRRNIDLNGVNLRADARQSAVGSHAGKITFSTGQDTINHVLPDRELQPGALATQTVPMTTLDEALSAASPAMIKIDVEGYETEVIRRRGDARSPAASLRYHGADRRRARYGFGGHSAAPCANSFEMFSYEPFRRALNPTVPARQTTRSTCATRTSSGGLRTAPRFVVQGLSI